MLRLAMQINTSVDLSDLTGAFPAPFLIDDRLRQFAQDSSRPSRDPSEPVSSDAPMVLLD